MAAKFKFLLLYFLSWVLFFDCLRILFLIYHSAKTKELPFSTIAATFWYGLGPRGPKAPHNDQASP
jgi:hypothetical protein